MSASESRNDQSKISDAPFDNPEADVILRSCDGVDFHVFKIVLSLASPVFADMFSIPAPSPGRPESQTVHDGLPVVQLSESSKVLDLALRHCYPIRSPELVDSKDALALLEFGRKFEVEALIPPLTCYLKLLTERDPVSAYCLAVNYHYDDIVEAAARSCLKLPITKLKCDVLGRSTRLSLSTIAHVAPLLAQSLWGGIGFRPSGAMRLARRVSRRIRCTTPHC